MWLVATILDSAALRGNEEWSMTFRLAKMFSVTTKNINYKQKPYPKFKSFYSLYIIKSKKQAPQMEDSIYFIKYNVKYVVF